MKRDMLVPPTYEASLIVESEFGSILDRYISLARDAGLTLEDESLSRALVSDLKEFGGGGLVSSVQCTMKTHKPQTEIKVRPIHASIRHPFAPAMRWAAKLIRDYLRSFSHLVRDSSDVVSKLSRVWVPPRSKIIKIDVDNFFFSGSHRILVDKVKLAIIALLL